VAGEMAVEKFAGQVADGLAAKIEDGVIEYALAHADGRIGMPSADDDSRGGAADEVGIGGMPVLVVSTLQEGGGDSVPGTANNAAVGHHEVARIFMEERVEKNAGDDAADNGAAVVRGVLLKITTGAGAVFGIGTGGLLNASADAGGGEEDWIRSGTDGELELLAHVERCSVPDVAGVVVGKNAKDALMELVVELGIGDLYDGECDGGVGGSAGDGKSDFGEFIGLAGFDIDAGDTVGVEARRGDGDDVGAGEEIGKAEVAFVVGVGFLRGLIGGGSGALGGDVSTGDEAALNVADDTGEAAVSFWARGRGVLRSRELISRELRLGSVGESFRIGN